MYLTNALVPTDGRVAINAQHRDEAQTDLTIEYTLRGSAASTKRLWPLGVFAAVAAEVRFGLLRKARRRYAGSGED